MCVMCDLPGGMEGDGRIHTVGRGIHCATSTVAVTVVFRIQKKMLSVQGCPWRMPGVARSAHLEQYLETSKAAGRREVLLACVNGRPLKESNWRTMTARCTSLSPPREATQPRVVLEYLDTAFQPLDDATSVLFGSLFEDERSVHGKVRKNYMLTFQSVFYSSNSWLASTACIHWPQGESYNTLFQRNCAGGDTNTAVRGGV